MVLTVIEILTHAVVLHMPCALTKYVVEVVGLNIGDSPVATEVPPHEPLNQFNVAPIPGLPPIVLKVVVPPAQIIIELPVAELAWVDGVPTFTVVLTQVVVLHNPTAFT